MYICILYEYIRQDNTCPNSFFHIPRGRPDFLAIRRPEGPEVPPEARACVQDDSGKVTAYCACLTLYRCISHV